MASGVFKVVLTDDTELRVKGTNTSSYNGKTIALTEGEGKNEESFDVFTAPDHSVKYIVREDCLVAE